MSIPKTIHYCWFGKKKLPKIVTQCLESWKIHLPDYEIVCWDETNFEIDNAFARRCYKKKKWAFVSDYARLKILYQHGGIYMDTDMFLIKGLDSFLNYDSFFGSESDDHISCGIIGSKSGNHFIKGCLDLYTDLDIPTDNRWYKIAIPQLITKYYRFVFEFNGKFNQVLEFNSIIVFPKEYFYSMPNFMQNIDVERLGEYTTENSFAVHLWESSWMPRNEFELIFNRKYTKAIKQILQSIVLEKKGSRVYYKKVLKSFKKSLFDRNYGNE